MQFKAVGFHHEEMQPNHVPVSVIRPRGMSARRWAKRVATVSGLGCAIFSGATTATSQMPAYNSGKITTFQLVSSVTGASLVSGAAGAIAGYSGLYVYSMMTGSARVAASLTVAAASGLAVNYGAPYLPQVPRAYSNFQAQRAAHAAEFARNSASQNAGEPEPVVPEKPSVAEIADQARVEEVQRFDAPPFKGPWNDDVLYVGMNKQVSPKAARKLQQNGAKVTLLTDNAQQDTIRVQNRVYNLSTDAGITNFAAQFGLPEKQTEKVEEALKTCEKNARDELAQIAMVWVRAEKGGMVPSRFVLAGHSNGDGVWGDNNGSLRLGSLRLLAQAMPHAARQIEDAFVTGCYSGGEVTMDQYLLIMPQAKTIWAYEAQAPGVDNGGAIDQVGWEMATRGRNTQMLPRRNSTVRKQIAVWHHDRGYIATKPPLNMDQMRGKVQWMQKHFYTPAFNGRNLTEVDGYTIPVDVTDPQTGLVRQYYSWLCRLTQFRQLPDHEREAWNERKHQAIRLIYYSHAVAPRFSAHYREDIRRGYASVGMTPPDYSRMDRARALAQIHRFSRKVQQTPNAKPEAKKVAELLQRGLVRLDPTVIPDGWV